MSKIDADLIYRNPNGSYMSKHEIAEHLYNIIDQESRDVISFCPREELIKYHHSLGQAIRNAYGLWHADNPHTKGTHPDDVSHEVLGLLWDQVKGIIHPTLIPVPVEEQSVVAVYDAVAAKFKELLGK